MTKQGKPEDAESKGSTVVVVEDGNKENTDSPKKLKKLVAAKPEEYTGRRLRKRNYAASSDNNDDKNSDTKEDNNLADDEVVEKIKKTEEEEDNASNGLKEPSESVEENGTFESNGEKLVAISIENIVDSESEDTEKNVEDEKPADLSNGVDIGKKRKLSCVEEMDESDMQPRKLGQVDLGKKSGRSCIIM